MLLTKLQDEGDNTTIEDDEEEVLNIYDVFLNPKFHEKDIDLYNEILKQKINLKKMKVRKLKEQIERSFEDKWMDEFLYFLKHYIPHHGRLRRLLVDDKRIKAKTLCVPP